MKKKSTPKKDGRGFEKNKGHGGCPKSKQPKTGKGRRKI